MERNNDTIFTITVPWRSFSEHGRQLVLMHLLRHSREDLGVLGLEVDAVPLGKLAEFANIIDGTLSFSHNLPQAIAKLHRIMEIDATKTGFLRREASLEMMMQLFRMSRREYSSLIRNLGISRSRGRPNVVAPDDRYEIAARWDLIREEEPNLLRSYVKLAEAYPEYKLSTLHALVRKL